MRNQHKSRAGFTLVEMMVVMALTMFVMVILSQAFVTSLDTFSAIKGIGDMQQNLRVATTLLRDDLRNDHFPGKRRLSDVDLTTGQSLIAMQPPQAGFFALIQGSTLLPTNTPPTPGPPPVPLSWPKYYYAEGNDTKIGRAHV